MQRLRCLAVLGSLVPALAQAAPPVDPPAAVVAQPDPLKPAFEALPEGDRRALQDALIWTGDFNGAALGGYGPRTRDALLAFAGRGGIAPAAALDPPARRQLLAAADAARRAAGFTRLNDPRAGLTIGLPSRLLSVRTPCRTAPAMRRRTAPPCSRRAAGPGAPRTSPRSSRA